jgi:hypothetical protein
LLGGDLVKKKIVRTHIGGRNGDAEELTQKKKLQMKERHTQEDEEHTENIKADSKVVE